MSLSQEKIKQLEGRMAALGIHEDDLEENFIRGSGKGGQKVNVTSSCVQLLHKPSETEIKCQQTRSQRMNRYYARKELCDRLEEIKLGEKSKRRMEAEKIRRQKRRRSRRSKAKMMDSKTIQGAKKKLRGKVRGDD
ncbi:MAG: protein subunit release factor B [Kiritimatiellia bacterium]|jgi:peptide chain release factor